MTQKGIGFKPQVREGDCVGHVFIDLGNRTEQAFSRQAAEEIVAGAFTRAEISGPDFHYLIKEIEITPLLKRSRRIHLLDVLLDLKRHEPQLRSVQKMVVESEFALA